MGKEVVKHTFKFKEQRRTIYLNAMAKDEYGRHRGHVLYGMKLSPNGKKIKIGPGALYTPFGTKIFLDITDPLTAGLMEIDLTAAENLPGGVAPDVLDSQYFPDRPIVLAVVCKFDNYLHGFGTATPDPSGNLPVSEEIGQDKQDNPAGYQQVSELEIQQNLTFLARPVTWDRIQVAPDFNFIALEPIFMNRDPQTEADPAVNIYDVKRTFGSASVAPVGSGASVDGSSIGYDEILLGYVIIGAPEDGEVAGGGLSVVGAGGSGGTAADQFAISPAGSLLPVVPGQILNVSGSTNCVNDGAFTILVVDPNTGLVTVSEPVSPDTIGSASVTAAGNDLPVSLGTPTSGWAAGISCIQARNVWEATEDFLGRDVLMGRNDRMVTSSPAEVTDDSDSTASVDVPTSALHQIPGQFNIGLPGVDALALTTLMLAPKFGTTNIDPDTGFFAASWSNYRLPSFLKDGDSLLWNLRRLDYILRLWMDRTGDQTLIGMIQDGNAIGQDFMSPLYKILKNFNGSDGQATANSNLNQLLYADSGALYDLPGSLIGGDPSNRVLKSGPIPHRDFQGTNINSVLGSYFGDTHLGAIKALDVAIWNILENILGTSVVRSLLRTTASWDQDFFGDLPINILVQPSEDNGNYDGGIVATTGYLGDASKLFAAVSTLVYRSQRGPGDNLLRNHSFWAVDQDTDVPKFWTVSGSGTLVRAASGTDDVWSLVATLGTNEYFQQGISADGSDASFIASMGNLLSASVTLKNTADVILFVIGDNGFSSQMTIPASATYRTVSFTSTVEDPGSTTNLIFRLLAPTGAVVTVLGACLNAGMPNAGPVSRIAADFLSRDGGEEAAMRGDLFTDGNAINTQGGEIFTEGAQIHGGSASAEGTAPYDFVTLSQLTSYSPTIGGTGVNGSFGAVGLPMTTTQLNTFINANSHYLNFTEAHIIGDGTPVISPVVIRCTGDLHLYGDITIDYLQDNIAIYEDYTHYAGGEMYIGGKAEIPVYMARAVVKSDPRYYPPGNVAGWGIPFPFYQAYSGEEYATNQTSVDYRRFSWESVKPPISLTKYSLSGGGGGGTGRPSFSELNPGWGCMGSWGSINANTKPAYREAMYGAGGLGIPSMQYGDSNCVFKPALAGRGGNGSSILVTGAPGPLLGGTGGRAGGTFIALVDGSIYLHGAGNNLRARGEAGGAPPQAHYLKTGKAYNGSGGGGGGGGQIVLLAIQNVVVVDGGYNINCDGGNGGAYGGGTGTQIISNAGGGGGGGCAFAAALGTVSNTLSLSGGGGTNPGPTQGAAFIGFVGVSAPGLKISNYKVFNFPFGGQ